MRIQIHDPQKAVVVIQAGRNGSGVATYRGGFWTLKWDSGETSMHISLLDVLLQFVTE